MAHILYLDDEEPLVFLATRMLKFLKHEAEGFTRAADALAAFQSKPDAFDLVLTDLSMPYMGGLEFAKQILAIRPDAAVVVATGCIEPRDEEAARALGVLDVVMKPGTIEDMARTVNELLKKTETVTTDGR